jgi:transposase, IS5 family
MHAGRSNTPRPSRARTADGAPRIDLAVPAFGYKNHLGIDRRHRLIRCWTVTDAVCHDGALLPALIDANNTARDVWALGRYRLSLPGQ